MKDYGFGVSYNDKKQTYSVDRNSRKVRGGFATYSDAFEYICECVEKILEKEKKGVRYGSV